MFKELSGLKKAPYCALAIGILLGAGYFVGKKEFNRQMEEREFTTIVDVRGSIANDVLSVQRFSEDKREQYWEESLSGKLTEEEIDELIGNRPAYFNEHRLERYVKNRETNPERGRYSSHLDRNMKINLKDNSI